MTTYNEIEMWLALKAENLDEFVDAYTDQFSFLSKEEFVLRVVRLWRTRKSLNMRVLRTKNKYDRCKLGKSIVSGNGRVRRGD
jgi:hypothetical protein